MTQCFAGGWGFPERGNIASSGSDLYFSLKPSLEIPEGTQTLRSGVELKIEQSGWHSAQCGAWLSQLLQMALCNTLRVVQPAVI